MKHLKDITDWKEMVNQVVCGNCLDGMPLIADKSIDMILCDLPYGTTACSWDTVIPFEPLWKQYKRIIKDNGAIVLTASQPFTSALVMSNIDMFKYALVWEKDRPTGLFTAKIQPMKYHEDILVFGNGKLIYNPQMLKGEKSHSRGKNLAKSNHYGNSSFVDTTSDMKYPKSILKFNREHPPVHPTQKPVALFEYLVQTYTNEGDLVLDNCAGSGTTGVACKNLSRNFILMEISEDYCKVCEKRLEQEVMF